MVNNLLEGVFLLLFVWEVWHALEIVGVNLKLFWISPAFAIAWDLDLFSLGRVKHLRDGHSRLIIVLGLQIVNDELWA